MSFKEIDWAEGFEMWLKLKIFLFSLTASNWLGAAASPSLANELKQSFEQAIDTCELIAMRRVPFESLSFSDWYGLSRDRQDHGNSGKKFSFNLLHRKVPWLSLNISASGVGATNGITKRTCSLKYNGIRHSFDDEKQPDWMDLSPEIISEEFSGQLHNLFDKLTAEKFEQFERDLTNGENEISLRKCEAGIRLKASLILHDPEDNRVDGFFSIDSTDWGKPC